MFSDWCIFVIPVNLQRDSFILLIAITENIVA